MKHKKSILGIVSASVEEDAGEVQLHIQEDERTQNAHDFHKYSRPQMTMTATQPRSLSTEWVVRFERKVTLPDGRWNLVQFPLFGTKQAR